MIHAVTRRMRAPIRKEFKLGSLL